MFAYLAQKHALGRSSQYCDNNIKQLKQFLALNTAGSSPNQSNIYYMDLLDENPDSDETMLLVAEKLLNELQSDYQDGYIVLVGDGKTYEHLMNIKRLYGSELEKLLIFPGDWHTLLNYQKVLMKIFLTSGLKDLAKASGFRGETLASLERCSNFDRTHEFLMQVWEALYLAMLGAYQQEQTGKVKLKMFSAALISEVMQHLQQKSVPSQLFSKVEALLAKDSLQEGFLQFIHKQSSDDDTWKFWSQFVLKDCFAYVCLYLAIRSSNWHLRISGLKQMAPIFAAFDRSHYEKIILHHLADILQYPDHIRKSFEAGAFTVSIRGHPWRSVGIDEAHEMCINKDMKSAIVRPTKAYLQKTLLFYNYRIVAYKYLYKQLFPEPLTSTVKPSQLIFDDSIETKKKMENVLQMCRQIDDKCLLPLNVPTNRGLINVFSGAQARPEQAHDLLTFRDVGTEDFFNFVRHRILHEPSSAAAPIGQRRLLTMAPPKVGRRKISQKEKEQKQVTKCLRRQLAWY